MRRSRRCGASPAQDTELGGRQIAAGDFVWLVFGAANLDPQAFERPSEVDLDRSPNRHVGFGRGIHLCIGAPLARLEVARSRSRSSSAERRRSSSPAPSRGPRGPGSVSTSLPLSLTRTGR